MAEEQGRIIVTHDDDIIKVEFNDKNIIDEGVIQHIGSEIAQLINSASDPKLLISFEGVEHLSSAALGTLITINNQVRQKGGQLRLADIHPQIYEVFVITKLNKLFKIHGSTEEAAASFN